MENKDYYLQFYNENVLPPATVSLLPISYTFVNVTLFPLSFNSISTEDSNLKARLTYLAYERRIATLTGDLIRLQKVDHEINVIINNHWIETGNKLFFLLLDRYDLSLIENQLVINNALATYIDKSITVNKKVAPHKSTKPLVFSKQNTTNINNNRSIQINKFNEMNKNNEIFLLVTKVFDPIVLDSIFTDVMGLNTKVLNYAKNMDIKYLVEPSNIKSSYRLLMSNLQKKFFLSLSEKYNGEMKNTRELSDLNGLVSGNIEQNKFIVLGYMNTFLRETMLSSMFDFEIRLKNTKFEITISRWKTLQENEKLIPLFNGLLSLDMNARIIYNHYDKTLDRDKKELFISVDNKVSRSQKIINKEISQIVLSLKERNINIEELGSMDKHKRESSSLKTYQIDPGISKIVNLAIGTKSITQENKSLYIDYINHRVEKTTKDFIVLDSKIFLNILSKDLFLLDDLFGGDPNKSKDINVKANFVVVDIKAKKDTKVYSKVFFSIKGKYELLVDTGISLDKALGNKLISYYNESRSVDKKFRNLYLSGINDIERIANEFSSVRINEGNTKLKLLKESDIGSVEKKREVIPLNADSIEPSIKNIIKLEVDDINQSIKNVIKLEVDHMGPAIKNLVDTNFKLLDKHFRSFDIISVNQLQRLYKDVIILSDEAQTVLVKIKEVDGISSLSDPKFEKLKNITTEFKSKLLEDYSIKNVHLLNEFVYTEMFKRWYFTPEDGPKDWMILPLDYPYYTLPVNGIQYHPFPSGSNMGTIEVPVNIYMIIDVLDFCFELWQSHSFLYSRYNPDQALKHFVNLLHDWLHHQVPDKMYKMPTYYPEDYQVLPNNVTHREDYWRIYRWIRWYAEALVMNVPVADISVSGNIYIRKLLDDLITYFDDHHGVYVSPFQEGNTLIDKIKGIRHKWLELRKTLI